MHKITQATRHSPSSDIVGLSHPEVTAGVFVHYYFLIETSICLFTWSMNKEVLVLVDDIGQFLVQRYCEKHHREFSNSKSYFRSQIFAFMLSSRQYVILFVLP
jgi:hypothetical protein